jgi:hypothetical protein
MIRDIPETEEWACLIADGALRDPPCQVGTVIGRHVTVDGKTLCFRVRPLVGPNVVLLAPAEIEPLPPYSPRALTIPSVPDSAVTVCGRRS